MQEKNNFRFAEKCLYEYKRNLSAINILREDLRVANAQNSVHVQNYQLSFGFGGEPSNPVEERVIKIEKIKERIQKLERCTNPITQLIADLNTPENLKYSDNKTLFNILKLLYFGKNTVDDIVDELHLGRRTFARKRRELVFMACGYLAL